MKPVYWLSTGKALGVDNFKLLLLFLKREKKKYYSIIFAFLIYAPCQPVGITVSVNNSATTVVVNNISKFGSAIQVLPSDIWE